MTWNIIFLFVCAAVLAYGTLEVASQKCKKWPFPSHKQLQTAERVTKQGLRQPSTAWDFGMKEGWVKTFGSHIFLYDEKEDLWHMERRDESEILDGCVSRAWKVSDSLKSNDRRERNTPFAAKLLNINVAEKKRGILYTNEVEALEALNRLEAHSILSHPWPNDPNKLRVVRCQNRNPRDLYVTERRCSEGATAAIVYKTAPGSRLSNFKRIEELKQLLIDTVSHINYESNIALRQITTNNMNFYQTDHSNFQFAPADLSMAVNLKHVVPQLAGKLREKDRTAAALLLGAVHKEL